MREGIQQKLEKFDRREAEATEKRGKCGPGVIVGGFQDVALQRCLLKLPLGFLSDFAFQIGVWRGEEARVSGIDAGFGVVQARNQDLRFWNSKRDRFATNGNVLRLQLAQVHASNDVAMNHE